MIKRPSVRGDVETTNTSTWIGAAWRTVLLWVLFWMALACVIYGVVRWHHIRADNRVIAALEQGYDLDVSDNARAEVAFARLNYLVYRDRLDQALPWVEMLSQWDGEARPIVDEDDVLRRDDDIPPLAAQALYNMGNGRLRHAFELLEQSRLDKAPQSVQLAKDYYTRALRLAPQYWEARYNLDIATRLVRNLPRATAGEEEESPETPKELWTQLPGLPRGLP